MVTDGVSQYNVKLTAYNDLQLFIVSDTKVETHPAVRLYLIVF